MNKPGANNRTFIFMDTPKLNKMHPIDQCFFKNNISDAYKKSIAIGSLKSLRTKIE